LTKKGDTLFSIGLEYGFEYKEIATVNNINAPYTILIGQKLNLASLKAKSEMAENGQPAQNQTDDGVVLTPIGAETAVLATKSPEIKSTEAKPIQAVVTPILSEPKALREPYSVEAFDKTAKILGLPYPGGPLVDKYAQAGNPHAFTFPEPQIPDLNFSFSGLKTSILYFINKGVQQNPNFIQEHLEDICASVQNRIITILLAKLTKAAKQHGISQVAIAGGVSANSGLRKALQELAEQQNWEVFIPKFEYCTDNAAMIAIAGYYKFLAADFVGQEVAPLARMPM
jgi:DNA-binding phage protein